ncbi:MAG: NADH-quinone oxidoreductase subunit NuoF, partial [Bacillota bacterium]|nr:NADH-quinone oxidoreductase subunit NuoF [Bacillota bacterium]
CQDTQNALTDEISKQGLDREIKVIETGCIGTCDLGPVVVVYPDGVFYRKVEADDAREIVKEHLLKGRVVNRLLYRNPLTSQLVQTYGEMEFFNRQLRVALRNTGVINPDVIEEYIARDGYEALARALTTMSREDVISTLKQSGLRGRGGAGFPTGLKWQFAYNEAGPVKYVVCNADEGDPGAFMDRSILEGDPHTVIEAMAIAGYAIGSEQGYVYVRAEYPLAVKRLQHAIEQARSYGFLGQGIFSTSFNFDLDIRVGAGAFVCGEETALIASIEGKRGEPRSRPPFPAVKGLWGKPTIVNNVETFANICPIIIYGSEWYSRIGTEKSKGTKVFAVAGNINNTGLVEVPMGMTLRQLIFDVCGGIPDGKEFKAAQTGGPSGGCLTKEHLDVTMEYDSLVALGSMMGSGGLIVMDENTCMVDIARYFLDFTQDESCGKCTPCRIGTKRMLEILERITAGEGKDSDIDTLVTLANNIKTTSLCGLGQSAPNPVLSTLKYFRAEYEAHIKEKRCPAGTCQSLLSFNIVAAKCRG